MDEMIIINMSVSHFNFKFDKGKNYILILFLSPVPGDILEHLHIN